MGTSRRLFLKTAAAATVAGNLIGCANDAKQAEKRSSGGAVNKEELERIAQAPVLKLDSLKDSVIVDSVELLRNKNTFLLRTRSKAGAEAMTVPNSSRMADL